jgi:hypothetical protein
MAKAKPKLTSEETLDRVLHLRDRAIMDSGRDSARRRL